MKALLTIALLAFSGINLSACLWDSDTLSQERRSTPDLAKAILGNTEERADPEPLRKRITALKATPKQNDPAWWNDLAGAHIRLGETREAVALLESVLEKFPDDYGIHANLGTAYHLLGRYQEAEKEIARDLEINPDAHFGLEKYHLALLQYLVRDRDYQSRHLYVDELSLSLLAASHAHFHPRLGEPYVELAKRDFPGGFSEAKLYYQEFVRTNRDQYMAHELFIELAALDAPPVYREKWNLAEDAKFHEGIIYMASLNPKEPACFAMLGVAAWKNRDLNLAATALEKAIELGSPQAEMLKARVEDIREHIRKARSHKTGMWSVLTIGAFCVAAIGAVVVLVLRRFSRS